MVKRTSPNSDVFLVNYESANTPNWCYVHVTKTKQPLFLKAADNGRIELEKFGKIVFHGCGDEPPIYYRERIEKGEFSLD